MYLAGRWFITLRVEVYFLASWRHKFRIIGVSVCICLCLSAEPVYFRRTEWFSYFQTLFLDLVSQLLDRYYRSLKFYTIFGVECNVVICLSSNLKALMWLSLYSILLFYYLPSASYTFLPKPLFPSHPLPLPHSHCLYSPRGCHTSFSTYTALTLINK